MSIARTICNCFVNLLFGCSHSRQSRPFTIEDRCYMVCLDCGRKQFYSTETMQPLSPRDSRRLQAALEAQPRIERAPLATPKPLHTPQPVTAGPRLVFPARRRPGIAA